MPAPKTYFVSDLHLFTRRSDGDQHLAGIRRLAAKADAFVLGGDIFDFRWTVFPTIEETVAQAQRWLAELSQSCPGCKFYMLLGNHDHHEQFMQVLDGLQERLDNLSWHPYFLRLSDSLFLHGDAADGDASADALARSRSRSLSDTRRHASAHFLYDLVVGAGLHRPVPFLAYPKKRTARRLLTYLDEIGHGPSAGVKNVYFGHTHRQLDGYRFGGLTFHNGGAPLKGVRFRILEAELAHREAA